METESESGSRPGRLKQIACATRGGEASRNTEATAIALARQHDAELTFLYIVDVRFAHGQTGKFSIDKVEEDVRRIGKLVLEQAKVRAREQGVQARTALREGQVVDEIQEFVEKHEDLDALVVGHMSEELREHLEPVLKHLAAHNLQVIVVHPEKTRAIVLRQGGERG